MNQVNRDPVQKTTSNFDSYVKMKMPAIGIDIGGTKISAALVAGTTIISEPITVRTPSGRENVINELVDIITRLREQSPISGIGVATCGVVDSTAGDVLTSANINEWGGTKLKSLLESRVLMSVYVDNDANAIALGAAAALDLLGKTCVVCISVGTGIGGGIIINGKPYHGASFAAGEVGFHRISLANKRLSFCGLFDTWEEYGAGRGLVLTTRELLNGITADQTPLAGKPDLSTHDIIEASREGDIIANKALDIWHQHLADGLSNVATILNPNSFVFSGGLSSVIDLEKLEELVKDRTLPETSSVLEFLRSPLGEFAGIVGAAQLTALMTS